MDWRAHITVDPAVCHGQAVIGGTRIPVSVILDNLAAGVPTEELLTSYAGLTTDSVRAALAYAAALAREARTGKPGVRAEIAALQDFLGSQPDRDGRSAEEIIGYDEFGLPR